MVKTMSLTTHFGMVYITYSWWNWGWFIIVLPTLSHILIIHIHIMIASAGNHIGISEIHRNSMGYDQPTIFDTVFFFQDIWSFPKSLAPKNHPVVMDDHDFRLKPMMPRGSPFKKKSPCCPLVLVRWSKVFSMNHECLGHHRHPSLN